MRAAAQDRFAQRAVLVNVFLLISESLLFLGGAVSLFRKERIYGIFFFFTYIYAIFSQIGYIYFPELSATIFAYFGEEVWRPATLFIIFSGIALFVFLRFVSCPLLRLFHSTLVAPVHVSAAAHGRPLQRAAFRLIAFMLFVETVIFLINYDSISWESAQKDEVFSARLALGVFILLVKLSVGINLALYCLLRQPANGKRSRSLAILFATSLLLFLTFTFRLGNRTDGLAMFLGIVVFETSQIRLRLRHFAAALGLVTGMVAYLNFLEAHRYQDGPAEADVAAGILLKDYYAPAHILFAAVGNQVVIPFEVFTSNTANALMFLGQPYLQAPVTETFYPGVTTRSASYGFYTFAEGYLFAGFAGFLYNGLVLGTLLVFWRSLATTDSPRFNNYLLAILGSMLVNLVRGQSSYFVKYLYTFILPNTLIYLCLAQQRILWLRVAHDASIEARNPPYYVSLVNVVTQLARRRWFILKVTGASMLAGGFLSLALPVRYMASTKIMPPQQNQSSASLLTDDLTSSGVVRLAAMAGGGLASRNQSDIYVGLLNSRPIADAIIYQFGLQEAYHANDMTEARRILAGNTQLTLEKSGIIVVSVGDKSKKRVAALANAYADQLRVLTNGVATLEARHRQLFYEDQLRQAEHALVGAQFGFQQVQQTRGLIELDAQSKAMIEGLATLRANVGAREVELDALRSYSTERNPDVELLEREVSSLRSQAAGMEQRNPSKQFANMGLASVPGAALDYLRVEHELKYRQTMVELLIKQDDAAKLDEVRDAAVIQAFEVAVEPEHAASPRRPLIVLACTGFGLLFGCLLVPILSWLHFQRSDPDSARQLGNLRDAIFGRRIATSLNSKHQNPPQQAS